MTKTKMFLTLNYQDETQVINSNKRAFNILIAAEIAIGELGLLQAIEAGVQKAVNAIIPTIISTLRSELRTTMDEIVNKKLEKLKEDMESHIDFGNQKVDLMANLKCLKNIAERIA